MNEITREKELLEEYIVLENPNYHGQGDKYFISKRSNFKTMNACEAYDQYGQKYSHEEVCGEDEEHFEIEAWNFWDGSNWRTIMIGEEYGGYDEASNEISIKILSELPKSPYIEGIDKSIKTENFEYYYSRRDNFNWTCTVK